MGPIANPIADDKRPSITLLTRRTSGSAAATAPPDFPEIRDSIRSSICRASRVLSRSSSPGGLHDPGLAGDPPDRQRLRRGHDYFWGVVVSRVDGRAFPVEKAARPPSHLLRGVETDRRRRPPVQRCPCDGERVTSCSRPSPSRSVPADAIPDALRPCS